MERARLFEEWSARYDRWFTTPMGKLVWELERDLILSLLRPEKGERVLDAGSGTGLFASGILKAQAQVVGLELSF